MEQKPAVKLYFTDYFNVSKKQLDRYGAFDISLVADLPLFIDPFLLFQSGNPEYRALHDEIIRYLKYLRDVSIYEKVDAGRLASLFFFSEVKQNYLGFTSVGNSGRGLGQKFAHSLNENLSKIFSSFGQEKITRGTHLEKLCLVGSGVGRDTISDFVTNLIKGYLLEYTQKFARNRISNEYTAAFKVERAQFNYKLESWTPRTFTLPVFDKNYVLLTPKEILTREDMWISRADYVRDFFAIVRSSPNKQLRAELDDYLQRTLGKRRKRQEKEKAIGEFTLLHPELVDHFIRRREDKGDEAIERSARYVSESEHLFIEQVRSLVAALSSTTAFYQTGFNTQAETRNRIMFLKEAIENKGCWNFFYSNNRPIAREEDLHVLFRLVWFGTPLDVSREVDDGRGPADFKISYGRDKTMVEFKLAKNSHLRNNLQNQLDLYKKASDAEHGYKVIVYFSPRELKRVSNILTDLNMTEDRNIILIDATKKVSASKVK